MIGRGQPATRTGGIAQEGAGLIDPWPMSPAERRRVLRELQLLTRQLGNRARELGERITSLATESDVGEPRPRVRSRAARGP